MSLTELALKNKLSAYLLVGLMCIFGITSYLDAEKAEDPGYTVKTAVITTKWPGATAEQVANLVSKKIEQEVRTLDSLDYVDSKNTPGESNVYVNLKAKYWDTFEPFQELMNKVNSFVVLPPDASKPVINVYFGNVYGTVLTLHSKTITNKKLYQYSEELKKQIFFNSNEVAEVKIYGRQTEIIYVDIDNNKLVEAGITLDEMNQTLKEANLVTEGGSLRYDGSRININPSGTFKTVDQIGDIVFYNKAKGEKVYLKELATLRKGYEDPAKLITYSRDEKAVVLGIALRKGENILKLKENVMKTADKFKETLPIGSDISITYNQGELVQEKISGFISSLFQAIIVIVAVCYLFLGMKTALIVASLTPTSIAATFIVMGIMGYGINQMTLAGLIIALGMLVDTAVVMTENITVLCQRGMDKRAACIKSANDLAVPLFAGAATTMAAMLPVIMNRETMGQYVGPMAVVVIISLLVSWAINQTLVPMLSEQFLDPKDAKIIDYETDKLYVTYRSALIWAVKNKKTIIIASLGSFVLGVILLGFVNKNFLPDSNNPTMGTSIRMPKGTSIEETENVVKELNKYIVENLYVGDIKPAKPSVLDYILTGGTTKNYDKDGILGWTSYIGGGGPKFVLGYTPEVALPEYAYVLTKVTDYTKIPEYSSIINKFLQNKYPGINVTSKVLQNGAIYEYDLSYVFSSNDKKLLNEIKEEVLIKLREVDGVRLVTEVSGKEVPEIVLDIDYNKAQVAGISTKEIANAIKFALKGYDTTLFYDFDAPPESTMVPIRIRGTKDLRDKLPLVGSIILQNSKGEKIPLQQVVKLDIKHETNYVYKRNMEDAILINAGLNLGYTATDVDKGLQPWIQNRIEESWAARGAKFEYNDLLKNSTTNAAGVTKPVPIAMLIVALIVIIQFNSLKKGFIIMATIPLTILGVAVGLIVTRLDFGFMAMVGLISLAGVIVNQAIVMLDTFQNIEGKYGIKDAILIGSQERLRPIMLTTYTTLIGLLPLYLFGGPLFESLAIVVMVGLAFGTVLTLIVTPALYAIVFKLDYTEYEYRGINPEKIED